MQLESLKAEQEYSFQMGFDRSLKFERCSVHSLFDPVTVGVVSSSSSPVSLFPAVFVLVVFPVDLGEPVLVVALIGGGPYNSC